MKRVYELFFNPGEIVEIRAIGGIRGTSKHWEGSAYGAKPVVAGYFNNAVDFAKAAKTLDDAGALGVYFTLNPCPPPLLARSPNKLKAGINTTTDANIAIIRWLYVDFDPKAEISPGKYEKVSGISSTDEEMKNAEDLAREVAAWLEGELGWAPGIRAVSGNGFHLQYPLEGMENTAENVQLIKRALVAIAEKFKGNDKVEIDRENFNPARIAKLYGTIARKGDHTEDRPYRKSFLHKGQPAKFGNVSRSPAKKLQDLSALAPAGSLPVPSSPPKQTTGAKKIKKGDWGTFHVDRYLDHYGKQYKFKPDDGRTGDMYILHD